MSQEDKDEGDKLADKLMIKSLEDETAALLNDIKKYQQKQSKTPFKASKTVEKKPPQGAPLASPKKARDDLSMQTPSKSVQKSKKSSNYLLSQSMDAGGSTPQSTLKKTTELFNPQATRVTVEVLDDASPDGTPREGYKPKGRSQTPNTISKQQALLASEDSMRSLAFAPEANRLQAEADTFVPGPGVTTTDVHKERDRLQALENAARKKLQKIRRQMNDRKEFLVQDRAATLVQKLFRGHIGRLKFAIEKKLTNMADSTYNNDWLEVRDRETGDVWFYNQRSGQSQWDRPDELFDFHANDSMAKTLLDESADSGVTRENIYDSGYLSRSNALKLKSLPSYEAAMEGKSDKISQYPNNKALSEEDVRVRDDINKELGLNMNLFRDKLSGPDGSFRPNLKQTVFEVLNQTRFDSVSSVLQDDRWMDAETSGAGTDQSQHKGLGLSIDVEEKVDLSRKPLVSVPKLTPKRTPAKGKVMHIDEKTLLKHNDMTMKVPNYYGLDIELGELEAKTLDEGGGQTPTKDKFMCFGCWSAGSKRTCEMHETGLCKPSETMLLCRNWELAIMRRRYRSEEIQEIFLKKSTSIRFDVKRKKFLTVEEQRHVIYRIISILVEKENVRMNLFVKIKRWMLSLIDIVRMGKVKAMKQSVREQAAIMRLRRTVDNNLTVNAYSRKVAEHFPLPPTTGYSWPERIGTEKYLFTVPNPALGKDCEMIFIEPIPVPKHLYLPRQYHLGLMKSVPMPKPDYKDLKAEQLVPPNTFIDDMTNCAWFERICHANANLAVETALDQVRYITPIYGLEKVRRSKQPPPCSIKFATIGRKPTPQNMDVGGLPLELMIYQLITTYFPAQYGSLMVMDKSIISPGLSPEGMLTFESIMIAPLRSNYVLRPVEHPLIYRRAPTIALHSKCGPDIAHFYGKNRAEQTGEIEPYGFRTNTHATSLLILNETDPQAFTPGMEIASLNNPTSNKSNTTHVDLTYPFCDPSSRDNTSLDFYAFLLQGVQSISTSQVFTCLSIQEPGFFLKDMDTDLPMGHLVVNTYRSWSFAQAEYIEEFKTDEGISYWFHRKTGQTFWERPLYEKEELHPLLGGTELDMDHPEEPSSFAQGDPNGVFGDGNTTQRRYTQGEFRKNQMRHHESDAEARTRRSHAANSASLMRVRGNLPNDPTKFKEKEKQAKVRELDFDDDEAEARSQTSEVSSKSITSTVAGTTASQKDAMAPEIKPHGTRPDGKTPIHPTSLLEPQLPTNLLESNPKLGGKAAIQTSALGGAAPVKETNSKGEKEVFTGLAQAGISSDLMKSLSEQITNMMANVMDEGNANEMIQMGLGMGMAMMQSANLLGLVDGIVAPKVEKEKLPEFDYTKVDREKGLMPDTSVEAVQAKMNADSLAALDGKQPIGKVNPTIMLNQTKKLDHNEADKQRKDLLASTNAKLTSEDEARMIKIQAALEATPTPDIAPPKVLTNYLPKDSDEKLREEVPLLIYPELSTCLPEGMKVSGTYRTHPVAGLGTSFVLEADYDKQAFVQGTEKVLRKTVMPLPAGFFNAITKRHIATQEVDYLPQVPNLPQPRVVGRVKPRSCCLDWLAIAFDPWSAGVDPLGSTRVESLSSIADHIFGHAGMKPGAGVEKMEVMKDKVTSDAFATVEDLDGQAQKRADVTKADLIAKDYKKICQLVRHNKYNEVEDLMNQMDWAVPIDYQDELGNSLIHVAAQNGNKRLIKVLLRRGAQINSANLSGQTPLHYCYGYGYEDVGAYLVKRGADDSIRNKDGLSCYEGLGARELALL